MSEEEQLSEEELLVYECEEVQSKVERIRAKVRYAEEKPQEANLPLVRVLTRNLQMCKSEYTKLHLELTFEHDPYDTGTFKKMKKEFDDLYRETFVAIQGVEIALLYPPVLHQPVMYVPVQFLQQQGSRIDIESSVTPGSSEFECTVATFLPEEPTPAEPAKVAIKVGTPSFPLLSNVIPSHDVLKREHPPAVSENPLLKVKPPSTVSSHCKPAVVTESVLSLKKTESHVSVKMDNKIKATQSSEKYSSGTPPEQLKQADVDEVAATLSIAQDTIAADLSDEQMPTEPKTTPNRNHRWVFKPIDCWYKIQHVWIDSELQLRPRQRKWRIQPLRPPEFKTTSAASNICRRPEMSYPTKHQRVLKLPDLSERFHPSAGGRMFGLLPIELTV